MIKGLNPGAPLLHKFDSIHTFNGLPKLVLSQGFHAMYRFAIRINFKCVLAAGGFCEDLCHPFPHLRGSNDGDGQTATEAAGISNEQDDKEGATKNVMRNIFCLPKLFPSPSLTCKERWHPLETWVILKFELVRIDKKVITSFFNRQIIAYRLDRSLAS